MFPDDGDDYDNLVTCSDLAMYEAKRLGGNRRARFQPGVYRDEVC